MKSLFAGSQIVSFSGYGNAAIFWENSLPPFYPYMGWISNAQTPIRLFLTRSLYVEFHVSNFSGYRSTVIL